LLIGEAELRYDRAEKRSFIKAINPIGRMGN